MIKPARDGTLRVLKASKEAGCVKWVVLTSSMSAIACGQPDRGRKPFTEIDWSDITSPSMAPYHLSKTLAEHKAWDYISNKDGEMELAFIKPAGVFGLVLSRDYAASMEIVTRLMNGQLPGCPKLYSGTMNVRNVADLHLRARTDPKAKGERFIAGGDSKALSMREMGLKLKALLGDRAKKVPTREVRIL